MHRWFSMILMELLRSDYRSRPDAPMFAKLTMDMVAALDPKALEGWDSQTSSIERLDGELRALIESRQKLLTQPPAALQ